MRTHYCIDIKKKINDENVVLCGWVDNYTCLKKFIFFKIRDITGSLQITVKHNSKLFDLSKLIKKEYVLKITGKVYSRPDKDLNKNIKNGNVEVIPYDILILNKTAQLPFYPNDYQNTDEENRLKYRYIDLRNNRLIKNLKNRSNILMSLRNYLNENNFLEIETPILAT